LQRDHVGGDHFAERGFNRAQVDDIDFERQIRLGQSLGDLAKHIKAEWFVSLKGKVEVGIPSSSRGRAGPEDPDPGVVGQMGAQDVAYDRQLERRDVDGVGDDKRFFNSSRRYSASARNPGTASATCLAVGA
jgi:hypothetical protein